MKFDDKWIIVTGGTRGIGAGIASAFLRQGAKVVVTFASNEEGARHFRQQNDDYADQLDIQKFDVGKSSEVEAFYSRLDDSERQVYALINNAGIRRDNIVGMMSEQDWDDVLNTNLKGCFLMSKFAVRRMSRARIGRIINITSPSGRLGFPGQGNYAAAKAGMVGFTRSLSQEVAKRKITVNCVSPGFISTDLIADLDDAILERYKNLVPLKRFGTVEDIANAVLYLASDGASYVTGSVLEVTGGL